jgi:transposase
MAEIGDIHRFEDVDQLLAYAGVHPRERSSGKKGAIPETSWTMAKTGNAYVRVAAYRMAVVGIQHNPSSGSTTPASALPANPPSTLSATA